MKFKKLLCITSFVQDAPVATPPKVDRVGQVLLDAAESIELYGWTQGMLFHGSQMCAMGAIQLAAEKNAKGGFFRTKNSDFLRLQIDARKRMDRAISLYPESVGTMHVETWNDMRGRTAEEVVSKLREAAVLK